MEFYRAGCVVSPYHIPLILTPPPPPPTPPQALHYSDSFHSLLSASWRLPGLARLATCPGTGPAGQSLASADESSKGQQAGFLEELGQIGLFRAPGGKIYLQPQRNGLPSASRKVVFWCLKHPPLCYPILSHPTSTLELYRILDVEGDF